MPPVETNGRGLYPAGHDPIAFKQFHDLVENILSSRGEFLNRFFERNEHIYDDCGYPDPDYIFNAEDFRRLYDREPVAARVVQVLPQESWQIQPRVYEDEDPENESEFEKAWDGLAKNLRNLGQSWYKNEQGSPIWEHLKRIDELSGIGRYGVLLLGIDDGQPLDTPIDGVQLDGQPIDLTGVSEGPTPTQKAVARQTSGARGTDEQYFDVVFHPTSGKQKKPGNPKLLFLRAFDEVLIQITQYEADPNSPRFGMPIMYRVTLNDPRNPHSGIGLPIATVRVHWSRVIHVADNLGSSEIQGVPRMQTVYNRLIDLQKLYSGSAEMYWRGAFPGLAISTHPQLGGDVKINQKALQKTTEQYMAGLSRVLGLMGMSAQSLAPQVVDPTPQIDTQIQAICIKIGIPQRIFMGSERGELASSQDDSTWEGRLKFRRHSYLTPKIIVPFVDRLIQIGVLPEPKDEGYSVEWPEEDTTTPVERAGIALQRTQALAAYISGNVESLIEPYDYLTKELGYTDEEAESMLDSTKEHLQDSYPDTDDENVQPGHMPSQPAPEPPPNSLIKMGQGETLIHPDTGQVMAKTPLPQQPMSLRPTSNFDADEPRVEGGAEAGEWTDSGGGSADSDPKAAAEDYKKNGTKSKAFKSWFGDWEASPETSSKVVDKKGEPQKNRKIPGTASVVVDEKGQAKVVFHGTSHAGFTEFDPARGGDANMEHYGAGFYFTEDKSVAKQYSKQDAKPGSKSEVKSVYLNIRNPFDMDIHPDKKEIDRLIGLMPETAVKGARAALKEGGKSVNGEYLYYVLGKGGTVTLMDPLGTAGAHVRATAILQKGGYDGVSKDGTDGKVWVAWNPTQIKDVHNKGTFSAKDPNILNISNTWQDVLDGLSENYSPDQPRDADGRFGVGLDRAERVTLDKELRTIARRIIPPDGGATYSPMTGKEPSKGYALSIHPELSEAMPVKNMRHSDLLHYIEKNAKELSKPGNYLGPWHNPSSGIVTLDVSTVSKDLREAVRLGLSHDQHSYFDLKGSSSHMINEHATSGGAYTHVKA